MKNTRGALRSALAIIAGALAGIGLLLVINQGPESRVAATTTSAGDVTPEQEEVAYQQSQRELRVLQQAATTTTRPVTTTTPPTTEVPVTTQATTSTTAAPPTTSTTLPPPAYVQDRGAIELNAGFGWISSPRLERGDIPLKRADIRDISPTTGRSEAGRNALLGGNAAWFDGSATTQNAEGETVSAQNLALPGDGGIVAIGGHRNGLSRTGPFGNIHLLQEGDPVTVVTQFVETKPDGSEVIHTRISTYRVTVPCPESDQSHCTDDQYVLHDFAQRTVTTETLFLFTCDEGTRIYVEAELVESHWQ